MKRTKIYYFSDRQMLEKQMLLEPESTKKRTKKEVVRWAYRFFSKVEAFRKHVHSFSNRWARDDNFAAVCNIDLHLSDSPKDLELAKEIDLANYYPKHVLGALLGLEFDQLKHIQQEWAKLASTEPKQEVIPTVLTDKMRQQLQQLYYVTPASVVIEKTAKVPLPVFDLVRLGRQLETLFKIDPKLLQSDPLAMVNVTTKDEVFPGNTSSLKLDVQTVNGVFSLEGNGDENTRVFRLDVQISSGTATS